MTARARHLTLVAVASLALGTAGCQRLDHRTGTQTMDKAMSKAFKRSFAAAYRMTTNHTWKSVVSFARFRCRPRGPEPRTDADWSWFCQVLWRRRGLPAQHFATYGVSVDEHGCFEAVTGSFPPRLHELVLNRSAANPLVYIRSCP